MNDGPRLLALDIGGANIKAAHETGEAVVVPFELWKNPDELPRILSETADCLDETGQVVVTMTAELCDCFETKSEGVRFILHAVESAFPGRLLRIWGTDERFHDPSRILAEPRLAAASNWLALANVVARLAPTGPAILIDVGSTTSDLIPLRDGTHAARGRTDTERLRFGELVYVGTRRTPVCAIASEIPLRGESTSVSAEFFATTHDVYLTLGRVPPDPGDHRTADGRPATPEAARDRLSRVFCADRDDFTESDALAVSLEIDRLLTDRLCLAAEKACGSAAGLPSAAIVSGSGEFLAEAVALRLVGDSTRITRLRDVWGEPASSAACAYALAKLAHEHMLI